MPAIQPWPNIPRHPAKNGCRLASRSTCWWRRNWMIACAVVSCLVFILVPVLKSAMRRDELQGLFFIRHEICAAVPGDDYGSAGIAHAGGAIKVPALDQPVNEPGGEGVPCPEDIINLDREAGNSSRRLILLEDGRAFFAALDHNDSRTAGLDSGDGSMQVPGDAGA